MQILSNAPFSMLYNLNMEILCISTLGNVLRYDLHSGAQGTIGQHHEVVSCIEFSQITGKGQFIALMLFLV